MSRQIKEGSLWGNVEFLPNSIKVINCEDDTDKPKTRFGYPQRDVFMRVDSQNTIHYGEFKQEEGVRAVISGGKMQIHKIPRLTCIEKSRLSWMVVCGKRETTTP